ncbi:MAG TPA: hypothetical protein VGV69_02765 [Solirubrobacterales bacterium]|nr:hypothetical protein [Solirubrobacterales bacterium]
MEAITAGAAAPASIAAPPQHMRALKRANEIRLGHAELKRDIKAGRVNFAQALSDPRAIGSISVVDLLKAQRRWGTTRARKFLTPLTIPENKRVDALTSRQRRVLVSSFPQA